jgi:ribonuclease Z
MVEKIELTFLGTGSSIPTARRNHPAVLLKYKAENILVDCGEGTQRQFRLAHMNPCKVTRILISHWHGDHALGLPGLLQTLVMNGYNRKLEIYGPRGSKEWVLMLLLLRRRVGLIRVS